MVTLEVAAENRSQVVLHGDGTFFCHGHSGARLGTNSGEDILCC